MTIVSGKGCFCSPKNKYILKTGAKILVYNVSKATFASNEAMARRENNIPLEFNEAYSVGRCLIT